MLRHACFIAIVAFALLGAGVEPLSRQQPQQSQQQQQKPKPTLLPARVTVTKSDGKQIAGLLTAADHDGIAVVWGPKSENLHFAWDEVKSISNGLTRDKVIADWKAAHAEKLCQKCHGDRYLVCPDCKGSGVDPKLQKECEKCKGSGSAGPCPTPGCKDGKIDCPAPCLKLSQGIWKDKDGMKMREFRMKNGGSHWWSTNHLGELIVYENGDPVDKGPCPTCGGTGKIDDPVCQGKGHKLCPDCRGFGFTGPACPTCDHGKVKCEECKGSGLAA